MVGCVNKFRVVRQLLKSGEDSDTFANNKNGMIAAHEDIEKA